MKNFEKCNQTQEDDFRNDPLYLTFSELLYSFRDLNSSSPQTIWSEALDCYHQLSENERPDIEVSGLVDKLCNECSSDETRFLILICTLFMLCCQKDTDGLLREAAKKIAATVVGHPLLEAVLKYQRLAEEREEQNGKTIPYDLYSNLSSHHLEDDHSIRYGHEVFQIPDGLISCIADESRLDEYCFIIRTKILPFIQSEEGTAQMWKVVMQVSKELGYVSSRCRTNRFAQLIEAICPEAGSSTKIDQNMQKYNKVLREKENDHVVIRSRFLL